MLIWEYTNYDKISSSILAHIVPESIKNNMPTDLRTWIFYTKDINYEELKTYDINNETNNYFVNIYCKE